MLALLPVGIQSNKISVEETEAAGILMTLEADLHNTHPSLNNGLSQIFKLPLPYSATSSGNYQETETFPASTFTTGYTYTTGVAENGTAVPVTTVPLPPYQATIIYTRLPSLTVSTATSESLAPMEARLIVNWPCRNTANIYDLTNPGKVSGYLDAYVAFPSP
jgi:hypothetical protein